MLSFLFETILQKHLLLNPSVAQKLSGKSILITLLPLKKHWKIAFNQESVICYAVSSEETGSQQFNLKLSAAPHDLLAMLLREDKTGLGIEGDVVLAQTLEQCFREALDKKTIEKIFQEYIGDFNFYPVKALFKKTRAHLKTLHNHSKNTITDYLQEDNDCLPIPSEVKNFCHEVDELRLRVDRLEARFNSGKIHEKN
jgi:ubiquinone biosynthesis protein UbiJ